MRLTSVVAHAASGHALSLDADLAGDLAHALLWPWAALRSRAAGQVQRRYPVAAQLLSEAQAPAAETSSTQHSSLTPCAWSCSWHCCCQGLPCLCMRQRQLLSWPQSLAPGPQSAACQAPSPLGQTSCACRVGCCRAGTTFAPEGEIRDATQRMLPAPVELPALRALGQCCALCNDSSLYYATGRHTARHCLVQEGGPPNISIVRRVVLRMQQGGKGLPPEQPCPGDRLQPSHQLQLQTRRPTSEWAKQLRWRSARLPRRWGRSLFTC